MKVCALRIERRRTRNFESGIFLFRFAFAWRHLVKQTHLVSRNGDK